MSIINRVIAPNAKQMEPLKLITPRFEKLNNGIQLYVIEGGTQDVTKVDIYFQAGLVQAGRPLLASTTSNLIEDGTRSRTSAQISEAIDFYGAHIGSNASYHNTSVSLITLTKYLPQTLEIVSDLIKNPIFPESEVEIYLKKKKQEFLLDQEKVKTLSARKFNTTIFGENHPYGMIVKKDMFNSIKRNDLVDFHNNTYTSNNCQIVLSGKPGNNYLTLLNINIGNNKWGSNTFVNHKQLPPIQSSAIKKHLIEKKDALQASLKIGRIIVTRDHKDFQDLQILNTILGGYFGSRLMKSIREEKGYTYGISSYIVPLKQAAYWVIATEVNNQVREDVISEIFNEIDKLRTKNVDKKELDIVKNYMLGDLLRNLDSPFSISDNLMGLMENNLDLTFYLNMVQSINNITPKRIRELAIQYLNPDDFITIIAG
ncbi:MAG: insulinase family protein [Marinilabiliaceae bacterium]|nr:insulinase family protein [Marinilabiliaceae bacterium]